MSKLTTIFYKIQVSDCNSNLYNDYYYFSSKLVYKRLGLITTFPNTVCFVKHPPLLLIPLPTPLYLSLSVALFHLASHMDSSFPLSLPQNLISSLVVPFLVSWLYLSCHDLDRVLTATPQFTVHSLDSELLCFWQHLLAVCHARGCKVQSVDVVCSESRCQWIFLMQHR